MRTGSRWLGTDLGTHLKKNAKVYSPPSPSSFVQVDEKATGSFEQDPFPIQQSQECLWFPLPRSGSSVSTQSGAPLCPFQRASGCTPLGRGEVSTFRGLRSSAESFTLSRTGTPLFQAGKVASEHPFRLHAPLCAHPPQGLQAQTHHLICGVLSSSSSHFETESKEEAGSGSVPTQGRWVFPITAPSPAPPRSALPSPRRHLSPPQKGLSAGIAGTYRCGARDQSRAR